MLDQFHARAIEHIKQFSDVALREKNLKATCAADEPSLFKDG